MPARLRVARSRLGRQRSLALGADRGHIGHDLVDPLGRETMAMMSRMSGLTAWFASARGLAHRLGGTQRIGRRGDRGVGRVLIEPFLEVPDEGFEFGDPRVELSALGTRRYWGRRGVVHAAGQYGLLTVWQEQVSSRGNSRHPPVKNEIPGHPSTKDAEQGTGRLRELVGRRRPSNWMKTRWLQTIWKSAWRLWRPRWRSLRRRQTAPPKDHISGGTRLRNHLPTIRSTKRL